MNTEISEASIYVGCGRIAVFTVKDNCYVTLKFRDDQKGVAPMDINKTPDLLVRALENKRKFQTNMLALSGARLCGLLLWAYSLRIVFQDWCLMYNEALFYLLEFYL